MATIMSFGNSDVTATITGVHGFRVKPRAP